MTSSTGTPEEVRPLTQEEALQALLLEGLGKAHALERILTTALPSAEGAKRADISDALDLAHKALGLISECTAADLHADFTAVVIDAGGGHVKLSVDRETPYYPALGAEVSVAISCPCPEHAYGASGGPSDD